ncbi:hypothetical protein QBC39DRAFT_141972 [Podospora conica]|nr:hypothetical protein QBC39DRAFT_141972 [Schizothecium conicum]
MVQSPSPCIVPPPVCRALSSMWCPAPSCPSMLRPSRMISAHERWDLGQQRRVDWGCGTAPSRPFSSTNKERRRPFVFVCGDQARLSLRSFACVWFSSHHTGPSELCSMEVGRRDVDAVGRRPAGIIGLPSFVYRQWGRPKLRKMNAGCDGRDGVETVEIRERRRDGGWWCSIVAWTLSGGAKHGSRSWNAIVGRSHSDRSSWS